MRYIPTVKLNPGMALGHDIYDGEGRMLLARHLILAPEHIEALIAMVFRASILMVSLLPESRSKKF